MLTLANLPPVVDIRVATSAVDLDAKLPTGRQRNLHLDALVELSVGIAHSLSLARNALRDGDISRLLRAIDARAAASSLLALNLSHNALGPSSAAAIATFLKSDACSLQRLSLEGNRLKDAGAVSLASGLALNQSLEQLSCCYCRIRPKGLSALAAALQSPTSALEALDVSQNEVCGLNKYGEGWFSASGMISLAQALANNAGLTELNLSHNALLDDGAVALASCLKDNSSLRNLDLSSCGIGNRGIDSFARVLELFNSSIVSLRLNDNMVDDLLLFGEMLLKNASLACIGLSNNPILDEGGLFLLRSGAKFRVLDLENCGLGPSVARRLVELVKSGDSKLVGLSVAGNGGIVGASAEALAHAVLESDTTLRSFSGIALDELRDGTFGASTLNLSSRQLGEAEGIVLTTLLQLPVPKLTDVRLERNPGLSGKPAIQLAAALLASDSILTVSSIPVRDMQEQALTELCLVDAGLCVTEAHVIAGLLRVNGSLRSLRLARNTLCGVWLEENEDWGEEIECGASYCPDGMHSLALALKLQTSLTELDLSGNALREQTMAVFEDVKKLSDAYRPKPLALRL